MWYHTLINSDENRMAKKKLLEQMKENQDNWYTELRDYAAQNNININKQHIQSTSYQVYKLHVKEKIRRRVKEELTNEKHIKTKLRHIHPGKQQDYFKECTIEEACMIMKIRLHMITARGNYGGGTCRDCNKCEETTEHVLSCQTQNQMVFDVKEISNVSWLRRASKVYAYFEEQYKLEPLMQRQQTT